jgi:hypothetical protein
MDLKRILILCYPPWGIQCPHYQLTHLPSSPFSKALLEFERGLARKKRFSQWVREYKVNFDGE